MKKLWKTVVCEVIVCSNEDIVRTSDGDNYEGEIDWGTLNNQVQ